MNTEFKTENIELLRSLRIQEKAIKADIARVKPLAEDEAKLIQPDGGKFTIDGIGDFVLDKDPISTKIRSSTSRNPRPRKPSSIARKRKNAMDTVVLLLNSPPR